MSKIKQKGTSPEIAVRSILKSLGYNFKVNGKNLPGSPDIYDPIRMVAIFVHGCFWHRHFNCGACTTPKRNVLFWKDKFVKNTARDRRKSQELRRAGYSVHKVWECQVKTVDKSSRLVRRLNRIFDVRKPSQLDF